MNTKQIDQFINLVQYMDSDISVTLKGKEWNLIQSALLRYASDSVKDSDLFNQIIKLSEGLEESLTA